MLTTLITDLLRITDVHVTTTWDARLQRPAAWDQDTKLEVSLVGSPEQEIDLFHELSEQADSVLVIAPEFDRLLADRCRIVESQNGLRLRGCAWPAVERCTDKLNLARQLTRAGIETIPTAPFDAANPEPAWSFPLVIKPRNGAGSQFTFRIDHGDTLTSGIAEISESAPATEFIQQPFVSGIAASAAAIFGPDGEVTDVFPIGRQLLSDDGRFRYLGCDLPGPFSAVRREQIAALLVRCHQEIPGLRGYVGFDLIIPEEEDCPPVLVEINPRLTTGYLAWRQLTPDNLADRILHPSTQPREIRWHRRLVRFRRDDLTE